MSISFDTIQLGFYTWVHQLTNLTVIWMDPNAPRPAKPYIALRIDNISASGWDYETPPDSDGMAVLFGNRELELEINYYGNNGLDVMEKIRTSLQQFEIIELLAQYGLFFIDRLNQLNNTELLDSRYEQRHLLELRFRFSNQGVTSPDQFQVGLIESTDINSKYIDEENNIRIESDIFVEK